MRTQRSHALLHSFLFLSCSSSAKAGVKPIKASWRFSIELRGHPLLEGRRLSCVDFWCEPVQPFGWFVWKDETI